MLLVQGPVFGQILGPLIPQQREASTRVDANVPGRLLLLEYEVTYGKNIAGRMARRDKNPGEHLTKQFWYRLHDVPRAVGEKATKSIHWRFRGSQECGVDIMDDKLYWVRQSTGFRNRRAISDRETCVALADDYHVAIHDFAQRLGASRSSSGGRKTYRLGLYIADDGASPLADVDEPTLDDFLMVLAEGFAKTRDRDLGRILLSLGRSRSLVAVLGQVKARLVIELAARVIPRDLGGRGTFGGRRRKPVPGEDYLVEQAALRSGFDDMVKLRPDDKIDNIHDSYLHYRNLAESTDVQPKARLKALERCLSCPTNTDYHDQWIRILSDEAFAENDEKRQVLIRELRRDKRTRSPQALAILGLSLLAGFVVSILILRFVSSRVVFKT